MLPSLLKYCNRAEKVLKKNVLIKKKKLRETTTIRPTKFFYIISIVKMLF